ARSALPRRGREVAEICADADAHLLDPAARHARNRPAAWVSLNGSAAVTGASPRRAAEAACRAVGERGVRRQSRFEPPERRADVITQRLEPRARACFAGFG